MERTHRIHYLLMTAALLLWGVASAHGQDECTDGNQCTASDMCTDGTCTGSFQSGGCDDGNPCTKNDHCQMDESGDVFCLGDQPADNGTPCGGGCGQCGPLFPDLPGSPIECIGDPADSGKQCDFGLESPCIQGTCNITPVTNFAFCFPQVKECPDTDGNPCTDFCNFETGACVAGGTGLCVPECETCNPTNGACEPANVGGACEDFDPCSPQSRCEASTDVPWRTFCVAGEPTGPTCTGDCNRNRIVVVNEMVTGVNIALGAAPITQCPEFDTNSSEEVEVNELIGGVNALLNGCA